MAYDRYDTRRDPRERWRSDEHSNRERGYGNRDERGFFERAGEQISSWFGDDDDRERRPDHRRDERGPEGRSPERHRDFDQSRPREANWDRASDERSYQPMAGDYSRGGRDFDRGRSQWDRDEYRRTSFGGARERSHDPHYAEWRNRQIDQLDRDYDDYRRENQSKFESDFGDWRTRRQNKRQLLGSVREHMDVVGSDEEHVGTVDRVAGDRIILTKSDPDAGGAHHSLPCSLIDRIEENRVILDCQAEQAKQKWRDDSRERALFEREDQGESGPMMLDRSFSGTYR